MDQEIDFNKLKKEAKTQSWPSVFYSPEGDFLEFLARPCSHYGERVDRWVTVLYSHHEDGGELVGAVIKDYSKLVASLQELEIEIQDGRFSLYHYFKSRIEQAVGISHKVIYRKKQLRKLASLAKRSNAEAPISLLT